MKSLIPKAATGLQTILNDKFTHHHFGIDSAKLPVYGEYHRDKRKAGYLGELFTKLDEITAPVIYWFDAADGKEAKRLFKLITSFSKKQKRSSKKIRRVVPFPNGKGTTDSRTLYVGKREGGSRKDGFTNIAERIEQHLGYNPNGMNQGLQLIHWSDGQFKLNILEFSLEAESYLTALELIIILINDFF